MIKQDMNAFRIPEQPPSGPRTRPASPGAPAAYARRASPPFRVPPVAAPAPPTETPAVARRTHPPVLQVLRSRLGTIAAVMAFGMALGFLVMLQFTPVYKATAIIAVEQPGEGVSQREATLKSWALAEKVILKLNLTRDPEINTALTSRSFYRISTWFTAARQRDDIVVPPGTQTLTLKPPLLAAFAARLEVIPAGANTIRITFRSEDPAKAARIANAVAAQLPLEQPPAGTAAGPAAELAALAGQLRLSQDRLEQYRASLAVAAPAAAPAVDGRAEAELAAARRRLAALEARQRKLAEAMRRGAGLETVAGLSGVPGMDTLRRQQSDMARREQELAATFGASHPETIALQQERRGLDLRIDAVIRGAADTISNEVAAARRALVALENRAPAAAIAGSGDPQAPQRLADLEVQVQADRTRYETMLARTLVPGEALDAHATGIRVTQKALPPESPVFPNQPMTLGISFLGSMMLAFGIALARGPAQGGVRRSAEIERAAKLPNLAMVPERGRSGRVADAVLDDPHGSVTTALRSLHATMTDAMQHAGVGVLAVTAAGQGAGTTSLAVSLARIAAREALKDGGRVILVDADFRRADIARQFADPANQAVAPVEDGLVEVLSGECDLAHAIRRDRQSPLEYLPIAAPRANPTNLLATQSVRRLMEALRQHYALVIINTPSVLDYPDARSLAGVADTFLVVASWDETPQASVVESVKRLRDAGASVSGTVINRCGRRHGAVSGAQAGQA